MSRGSSVNLSGVSGMTLAGGRVIYGSSTDGALRTVVFSGGAVSGAPVVVSSDGSWSYRAMFLPSG